jgi:hypothetical protein
MAPDDGPAVRPGGMREPAPEGAGTPLRGDLVCKSPFPSRASDKVQTDPRRTSDEPSTDRRRARRVEATADAGLEAVLAAARRPVGRWGGAGHSPLYEWLWVRFDWLSKELSPPRRPNWRSVADTLAARAASGDCSVLDGWGEVPGPETVRQTWWRVRKDKAAALTQTSAANGASVCAPPVPRPAPVRPTPSPIQPEASTTPAPARRFSMGARPRPWSPPPDASEE